MLNFVAFDYFTLKGSVRVYLKWNNQTIRSTLYFS